MAWVHVAAAVCAAITLCGVLRQRIERILPLMVCLSMPVLWVLAMLKRLNWVDELAVVVIAISLARWVYRLLRKERKTESGFLSLSGVVCFILLALFWFWGSQNRSVLHYDDFSYWATQVRSLFVSGGLVEGARSCCSRHAAYMPGMQLIEWWFMHLRGEWHEGTLFAAAFLTNGILLLPLTERIKLKQWWQIPLYAAGIILAPTLFSGDTYRFLAVDSTLGALFGLMLYTAWTSDGSKSSAFMLSVQMMALTLCKQSGLIWALFGLAFILFVSPKRFSWKRILLCLLPSLVVLVVWSYFCSIKGLHSVHLDSLGSGDDNLWANVLSVWRGMIKILIARPFSMSGAWGNVMPLIGLPPVVWMAILCGTAFFTRQKRCAAWMIGMFAIYTVILAASMPTVFAPEVYRWTRNRESLLQVMDRYMMPAFYGAGYLGAAIVLRSVPRCLHTHARRIAAAAVCVLLLLCVNWQSIACLLPQGYAQRFPDGNGSKWMRENLSWYQHIEEVDDSRVLTTNALTSSFDYALVPVSFARISLSEHDPDSAQTVRTFIQETSVTHLMIPDAGSETHRVLQKVFQCEILQDTLYRIDEQHLTLEKLP